MENKKNGFAIPIIIAIVTLIIVGVGYNVLNTKPGPNSNLIISTISTTTDGGLIGGDKDAHGCLGPAGYSWCEVKNKCLRVWEEKCEVATTTINDTEPIINSISQTSGPIGTVIELTGINLTGFEGDLDAIIENSKGETAYLLGLDRTNGNVIKVKIDSQICRINNSYSGLPCSSYLNIAPGIYNIYTSPWGKMSNKVQFTVTK